MTTQVVTTQIVGVLIVAVFAAFLAMGFITMFIAQNKNLSSAWFLVGFFYGPLGVLVALIAPDGYPPLPRGMVDVRCDRCTARQNVPVSGDILDCWRCHYPL